MTRETDLQERLSLGRPKNSGEPISFSSGLSSFGLSAFQVIHTHVTHRCHLFVTQALAVMPLVSQYPPYSVLLLSGSPFISKGPLAGTGRLPIPSQRLQSSGPSSSHPPGRAAHPGPLSSRITQINARWMCDPPQPSPVSASESPGLGRLAPWLEQLLGGGGGGGPGHLRCLQVLHEPRLTWSEQPEARLTLNDGGYSALGRGGRSCRGNSPSH